MFFTQLPSGTSETVAPPAPPDGKPWAQHPNEGRDGNAYVIPHQMPQQTRPKQGLVREYLGSAEGKMKMHKRPALVYDKSPAKHQSTPMVLL